MSSLRNLSDGHRPPLQVMEMLAPEEKVVWFAQPNPAAYIVRGAPNLAYGVTWAVLGAFWYRGSGGIGKWSAFEGWWRLEPLLSVPFILAGLSFFISPIKLGRQARRTWYVVTDRRALFVEFPAKPGGALDVHVFEQDDLRAMQFKTWGGMEQVILSRSAEMNPHLRPRLKDGFFGLRDGEGAMEAIRPLL